MVQANNYSNAFVELKEIIKYMNKNIINKIPSNLIIAIQKFESQDYTFKYDENLPLYEQKILPETKALLSILYSDYLCDEVEKKKWIEYDKFEQKKLEEIKSIKYSPKDLFQKSEENVENNFEKEESLIEYHESIFKKIWKKISSFLKLKF